MPDAARCFRELSRLAGARYDGAAARLAFPRARETGDVALLALFAAWLLALLVGRGADAPAAGDAGAADAAVAAEEQAVVDHLVALRCELLARAAAAGPPTRAAPPRAGEEDEARGTLGAREAPPCGGSGSDRDGSGGSDRDGSSGSSGSGSGGGGGRACSWRRRRGACSGGAQAARAAEGGRR